jgi:hypothetical protein
MSLPGIAEKLAYMNFDEACAPIFSYSERFKKFNEEIRDQLFGGCTMVFKRLVNLGENTGELPKTVHESKTGHKWKKAELLDFNRYLISLVFFLRNLIIIRIAE